MKQSRVCWCLALILIFGAFVNVKGDDEEEEGEAHPKTCAKYLYDFVMGILNSTLKCLAGQSTFKMNNIFDLATRASCILKCTLQEEGIVDKETGILDDIGAAFYFEEVFAQEVREVALPEAQACFALAEKFQPKEYWCKSYLPFIECAFRAILKGLIPYGGDCVANPALGILFSVIKYMAPDSPEFVEEMKALRRSLGATQNQYKCLDKNCTKMYEYKKVNGTQAVVLYNQNMEVLSVETRLTKPKPSQQSQSSSYQPNSYQSTLLKS